jgi:hypothetical protein
MADRFYEISKAHKGWLGQRLSIPAVEASPGNIYVLNEMVVEVRSVIGADGMANCHVPGMSIVDHLVNAQGAAGGSAVAIGDRLYRDGNQVNKDSTNGVPVGGCGYALEAITSGSSDTIYVLVEQ